MGVLVMDGIEDMIRDPDVRMEMLAQHDKGQRSRFCLSSVTMTEGWWVENMW